MVLKYKKWGNGKRAKEKENKIFPQNSCYDEVNFSIIGSIKEETK